MRVPFPVLAVVATALAVTLAGCLPIGVRGSTQWAQGAAPPARAEVGADVRADAPANSIASAPGVPSARR